MVTAFLPIRARPLALVADDDPAIQALVARAINRLGLVAVFADNGAAAVAAVGAHRDHLACAILDVVMPIVNGVDAAHAIQATAPGLPIVLMSGAIPEAYMKRISQLRLAGMLAKPFSFATLQDLLRQVAGDSLGLEKEDLYEPQP
jgi:two-component system, cell cycle sensor histidine kinase and response regulator CckA